MSRRRTLLGVWAHPDDEAYLSAGLMAAWRRRGDRVVVVTATLGELGTPDPDAWPPHRLAGLRRRELNASLAALDVDDVRVLGHADGGCHLVDAADGAAEIADVVDEVSPDVIVTFGADGMTGHLDHRAVSRWTTDAWLAGGTAADLWYATVTPQFHDRWSHVNDSIGLWAEQPAPPCTPADDLIHHERLDDDLLDAKVAALRAHASQTMPLMALLGPDTYREWWAVESFVAARRSVRVGASPADRLTRCPSTSS
ncbi:MAG: PIG-L deacetylase family protein [Ilumatobacteraceae bacterium]